MTSLGPLLPQLDSNLFLLLQTCSTSKNLFHPAGVASPENPNPSIYSKIPNSSEKIVPLTLEVIANLNKDLEALQDSTETPVQTEITLRALQRILQKITHITATSPSNNDAQSIHKSAKTCSKLIDEKITLFKAPPPPEESPPEPKVNPSPTKEEGGWFAHLRNAAGAARAWTEEQAAWIVQKSTEIALQTGIDKFKILGLCKKESDKQLLRIQETILDPQIVTNRVLAALPEKERPPELKEALKKALQEHSLFLSEKSVPLFAGITEKISDRLILTKITKRMLSLPKDQIENLLKKFLDQNFGELSPKIREIVLKNLLNVASQEIPPIKRETLKDLLLTCIMNQRPADGDYAKLIQNIIQNETLCPLLSRFEEEKLTTTLQTFFNGSFHLYQNDIEQGITRLIDDTMLAELVNCSPEKEIESSLKKSIETSSLSLPQNLLEVVVEEALKTKTAVSKETLTLALQNALQKCDSITETRLLFAENLSSLIITFLEEHLVHVNERELEFRAEFISKFFKDPSANTPIRTGLGEIVIPLIENNREAARELVRANVLQALANGYQALESYQNDHPHLLVKYIHEAFKIGLDEIRHEEHARTEGGTHLSSEERKRILDKSLQRGMTAFLLTICFPHGAENLFVPLNLVKTKTMGQSKLWELLRQIIENLSSEFLKDTIEFQDIKQSLLMMGLEKVTEVLSGQSIQPPTTKEGDSSDKTQPHRGGIIAVGMIAAFIKIIFDAIWDAFRDRKRTRAPSEYPNQDSFNTLVYSTYQALEKELFIGNFIPKRLSKKVIYEHIGPNLISAINEIRIPDLVDIQLQTIAEKIKPDSTNLIFPRTSKEKTEIKKQQEIQRKEDQRNIERLENHIGNNIEGLIKATYALWKIDTTGLDVTDVHKARQAFNRIKLFTLNFVNGCIYKSIRFFLWLFRTRSFVHSLGEKALKKTELLKQDIVISRTANHVLTDAEQRHIQTKPSEEEWNVKERSSHLDLYPEAAPQSP